MAYPFSRLEVSIQTASGDGLFYGRFPHGDKPTGAQLAAAANDATSGAGTLSTRKPIAGAASDAVSGSGVMSDALTATWTDPLPNAVAGVAYFYQLTAKGGVTPYVFSLEVGFSLPAGLALDAGTGNITGTPTVSQPITAEMFDVTDSSP